MRMREKQGYSFDDVLLVPQSSDIQSRGSVDLTTRVGSMTLTLPVLSANMDTVTEEVMARTMAAAGGGGVLHRFATLDEQALWLQSLRSTNTRPRIVSIGLDVNYENLAIMVDEYDIDAVCVDVAHGDHVGVRNVVSSIHSMYPDLNIIAGNVATANGAQRLLDAGANIIKVGIGPGSVCSTRVVSGHGVPQLSAIMEIDEMMKHLVPGYDTKKGRRYSIIADGGIRYPGDIVKALAAGADAVMLGSLLAGTDEAAGERIVEDGHAYKTFRGMASREAQKQKRAGRTPRVEGVSARVPYRGPLADTLANLEAGIRSGLSYSGAHTLAELRENAEFVVVTGNTLKESHPHHPYRL